jgi:hypothetical protein
MNILQAISDDAVFGRHFRGPSWGAWRVFLAALFGLLLTPQQLAVYQQCTGRTAPPTMPFLEAWLVCGRRSGKSFTLALVAVFLSVFKDWRPFLGPGEIATVMIIAADRRQARVVMRYCLGLLRSVPMLRRQIESTTAESITLRNSVVIEIHTSSFRSVRGYSIVCALLDELAYWDVDQDAASPDAEVINAVRPGMASVPQAMLLCASSPHSRRGALWEAYRKHYGKDSPVLVWQAATRDMNPSVPEGFIAKHLEDDPARASAEYLAQFRSDLESLVSRDAVMDCVSPHVYERPPQLGVHHYVAFCDPSGGSSDAMTAAIAHVQDNGVVLDCVREYKPPFSPETVVAELAACFKSYGVYSCQGDHFAGVWPIEAFSKVGIRYEACAEPKSILYQNLLPLINSKRIDLLDNARLINQLVLLERHTARSGRDAIDHPPNQHDDLINAAAGAAAAAKRFGAYTLDPFQPGFVDRDLQPAAKPPTAAQQASAVAADYVRAFARMNGLLP